MKVTKVLETIITGTLQKVKVLRRGTSDVQTGNTVVPFGFDSFIPKDYQAIYAQTENENKVILGVIHKNALAAIGESRLFSLKTDGTLATYVLCKNDGIMELGGGTDNAVKYSKLASEFGSLKTSVDKLITAFNSHLHATAAVGPPIAPTPVPGIIPVPSNSSDITLAKNDKIKTI